MTKSEIIHNAQQEMAIDLMRDNIATIAGDVSDMKLAREIVLFLGYNPYDGEEKGATYYNRSFR